MYSICLSTMDAIDMEDIRRWGDLCSICGRPVRYWHDQMTESDDFVITKWHKRCAKDYKEWLYKITHILPEKPDNFYIPKNIRFDQYLDNYYRRILNVDRK